MADDLTPWEEINPPVTVSAPQRGLPSKCLDRLTPASNVEFRNELTACLALTAPAGMTEEGRGEWLAVAWETLKHLPPDLLAIGCRKARETCDHPSKIVPAIVEATKDSMRFRHEYDRPTVRALPEPEPEYCSPEEAAKILSEYGLRRDWSAEVAPGSKPNGRDHEDGLDRVATRAGSAPNNHS